MAKIVAGECGGYDAPLLKDFLVRALAELDCAPAGRVLLKPNLLSGKPPEKAVNTHPRFVQAIAEILKEKGCTVFVGDSPGYESTEKALEKSGIMEVVRKLRLQVAPFRKKVVKANSGISPYRELVFGEDPLDYDLVVNMPKLKTHAMMGLTAGVKNAFGFVPGMDKAKWHLRCGRDNRLFASLLIDICSVVKPALTILDGIIAMDGDGPAHGRPRRLGLVAVSDNALSLDAFIEKALGLGSPLPISALGAEKALLEEATLVDLGLPEMRDFIMPKAVEVDWSLPPLVRETMRRVFTRKPKCNAGRCNACMTCVTVCPAGALHMGEKAVSFDYRACIRCYCCNEMCPTGAITL
ncbi:MAG: DUF362 domain-containing protein [Syntrophorhabdales bacterium]|jgi:uncharacterized protein (DUF362 family)